MPHSMQAVGLCCHLQIVVLPTPSPRAFVVASCLIAAGLNKMKSDGADRPFTLQAKAWAVRGIVPEF